MAVTHPRGVVAIGASAGGIDALQRLMHALPEHLEAAVCVVLHIPASSRSLLAEIMARQTELPVVQATAGDVLRPGHVYVAPPDRHLLVEAGAVRLARGPKENGVRPAIDPLMRSIAVEYGPRAIAVIASGSLSDGAAGVAAVAAARGTVLVQEPRDAMVPSMPEAALAAVPDARTFTAAELATAIVHRVADLPEAEDEESPMPVNENPVERSRSVPPGPPTGFTCPECHGPLWERREGDLVAYRCRVGHVFAEDILLDGKAAAVEAALWMAVEALEERGELLERVALRLDGQGREDTAGRLRERARGAGERAELIRGVLSVEDETVEPAGEGAA